MDNLKDFSNSKPLKLNKEVNIIRENIKTGETQVQESEQAKQTKGGDVGGPVQGPSLPKGGLSSLKTEESRIWNKANPHDELYPALGIYHSDGQHTRTR